MLKKPIPNIWELINGFEEWVSKEKGWNVNKFYDLIEVENEYYKFFWTHNFHIQTFKKILQRQSCSLGDDLSYRTVKMSYMVWMLNAPPEPSVWNLVKVTSCLSKRVAIYALNSTTSGTPNFLKLNETKNKVLEEFETFLMSKYGIKMEPLKSSTNFPDKPPSYERCYTASALKSCHISQSKLRTAIV